MAINTQLRRPTSPAVFHSRLAICHLLCAFYVPTCFLNTRFYARLSRTLPVLPRIRVAYPLYCMLLALRVLRKNGDAYSYLVGVDSVMGYRVMFGRTSLRGISEGGIVSQEEVEIQLGMELERNFSAWSTVDLASLDTALTSGTSIRKIY